VVKVQADDPIRFGQLAPKNELGQTEDMFELTLSQALGGSEKKDTSSLAGSKLNKVSTSPGGNNIGSATRFTSNSSMTAVMVVLSYTFLLGIVE